MRGRRERLCARAGHPPCDHGEFGAVPGSVGGHQAGDVAGPEHGEVRRNHLVRRGQVEPDLEQLERVGLLRVQQREHLGMHDALARGQPLHVALPEAGGSAQRIGMVDEAGAHDGHGLEAAVRMGREAGHLVAVVHAPAVLAREILPDLPARERRVGPQAAIAARVGIVVVGAEKEGVQRGPERAQGLAAEQGEGVDMRGFSRKAPEHVGVSAAVPRPGACNAPAHRWNDRPCPRVRRRAVNAGAGALRRRDPAAEAPARPTRRRYRDAGKPPPRCPLAYRTPHTPPDAPGPAGTAARRRPRPAG